MHNSYEILPEMARGKFEKNECLQKGLLMNWEEKVFPNFCEKMSCFLDKNGGKYFVGNQVRITCERQTTDKVLLITLL